MTRIDYGIITAAYLVLSSPAGLLIGLLIKFIGGAELSVDEGTKRMGFWKAVSSG